MTKSSQSFAYKVETLKKEILISPTGDATIKSFFHGLESTQNLTNLQIPYFQSSNLGDTKLYPPLVKELTSSHVPVSIHDIKISKQNDGYATLSAFFLVSGYLEKNKTKVDFSSEQFIEKAVAVSREQVLNLYGTSTWNLEYCLSNTIVPIEKLIIVIEFPYQLSEMTTKPQPVCFLQSSHVMHETEISRIKDDLNLDQSKIAILIVQNPTVGLDYGISWVPPTITKSNKL